MTLRLPRRLGILLIGSTLALGLAACGSGDDSADADSGSSDGYYPHTMETLHGEVTIEREPTTIVALTPPNAEELLSLDVTPTAMGWGPASIEDSYPWMADQVGDIADADLVVDREVQVEAVAALEPDLIVGATWLLGDEQVYDQLNDIAPTIVPDSDAANVDWDDRLRYVAEAVDAADRADELIADVEREYAAVGERVPGIEDKTYDYVGFDGEEFFGANGSVFELFGLEPAENQDNAQSKKPTSRENTSEFAADLLAVWPVEEENRAQLEEDPVFQGLTAVENGTSLFVVDGDAAALDSPGPLALRWLLDRITPTIEALGD